MNNSRLLPLRHQGTKKDPKLPGENQKPSLSIVVITLNEEKNIGRCLDSLEFSGRAFSAVEVVVVDAQSADRTVAIARQKGAKVLARTWRGFSDQKNWGIARATGDWILSLDADEELTMKLIQEMEKRIPGAGSVRGFSIKRRAFFLGKWIKHCGWWPDPQLRLFRKGAGRFSDKPVHEGLGIAGRTSQLREPMNHYTYASLSQYLEKLDRYTDLALGEVKPRKIKRWKLYLTLVPVLTFLRMFIFKLGFLDGWHGFVLCALSAYHEFSKAAKVWESRILRWKPWMPE